MRRRLEQFMQGRYGTDELTKFLMAICLILLLANTFTRQPLLYWLCLLYTSVLCGTARIYRGLCIEAAADGRLFPALHG